MTRPDQAKFHAFARPFERLDKQLESLSRRYQFEVIKNLNRQPCRVLQRPGNPHYLMDISYDDYWVEAQFRDDLPQSVLLIAYYTPPASERFVWKLSNILAAQLPLSQIEQNLSKYVEQASLLIGAWTPETILEEGRRSESVARKHYGGA